MYYAAKLTIENCSGCKICIMSCPDPNVIAYSVECKKVEIDEGRCKGCGLCVSVCPKDALQVSQL
jgi:Pyruvate/2-oxoacid:ferredoxin oxidoreductase delta subunit